MDDDVSSFESRGEAKNNVDDWFLATIVEAAVKSNKPIEQPEDIVNFIDEV